MNKIKLFGYLTCMLVLVSCKLNPSKSNTDDGWEYLFNGKNLDNWIVKIHKHELGDNYANTFQVNEGNIQVSYKEYEKFEERYGHLFYKEPFSNYHLKFEYRFTEEWLDDAPGYTYRNSGVMFHSQDPKTILKNQDWPISVEYQMLADAGDGNPRPTGNMCSPGTEVFFEGKMDPNHCISSSSKTYPWNEWVQAELIVQDSLVIHKVNGETVLKYTKTQIGGGTTNGYDPEIKQDGKMLNEGYIGLQAEGQGVLFREVKIKPLK
ncbi:3-keto-disaccharide hydrolase [Salegentibacter holothuriorum]|uniref:3-keto-disaccharide hydrolase n=1 Tax=Salegentibacter holothuriorum TaxID=241145 RepID=UPI001FE59132|nr:DUF1080 domain-containing protein [Salegentibacter holothuriorum]